MLNIDKLDFEYFEHGKDFITTVTALGDIVITILRENFKDVVVKYMTIELGDSDDGKRYPAQVMFEILDARGYGQDVLLGNKLFHKTVNDIILSIMTDIVKEEQSKANED